MNKEECIKKFVKEAEFYEQHYTRIDIRFVTDFFTKHLELYAASKAKEAYNQGVRDAAESAKIICVLPDEVEVSDGDDIVNIPEGELTNLKIAVNKDSILKLLK